MDKLTLPDYATAIANNVLWQQPHGGCLRCEDYPVLRGLIPFERYEGRLWGAQRRIVDQLDQVTFWRIESK